MYGIRPLYRAGQRCRDLAYRHIYFAPDNRRYYYITHTRTLSTCSETDVHQIRRRQKAAEDGERCKYLK